MAIHNPFGSRTQLTTSQGKLEYFRLMALQEAGLLEVERLPFTLKILFESLLRSESDEKVIADLLEGEIPFRPARVLLQDFTGVPALVDLAAMRSAMVRAGKDPARIEPMIPAELVVDHSIQVDAYALPEALKINMEREFERNHERYQFLKWGQQAFSTFKVIPPGVGIVHQVNLELLARGVVIQDGIAYPDSLVGTDSHTTMINGLGILGWGVGGIEAEAAMLGQPLYIPLPEVVGVKLVGELPEGVTATDLVLKVTECLRHHGVVGKFVEFFGPGIEHLSVPDRATIANMAPEYGATVGFFPMDGAVLDYFKMTGRSEAQVELVERYTKAQGLFWDASMPDPHFSAVVTLDLSEIEPSVAGPRRPQDRLSLAQVTVAFRQELKERFGIPEPREAGERLRDGAVVIAAITSCTNTSNPAVMLTAGLLAKKAVERGLQVPRHVKTSLAPGSRVVTQYLKDAGLLPFLEELGFYVVGYGCTTCIGNSGPLSEEVACAIAENNLVVAAVLSGNRNFEGRIHPLVRANYLASPPLVVAYALAGRMDIDLTAEPLGRDREGRPVYLRDLWPSREEIEAVLPAAYDPEKFHRVYDHLDELSGPWQEIEAPKGLLYPWLPSTYIQEPPFFKDMPQEPEPIRPIEKARVLVLLGDSVTTDHISPAGPIPKVGPAADYLREHGVPESEFNTFGARRGNHEIMMRGTFANIRLKNLLVPEEGGGKTRHFPSGEKMWVFDAAMRYRKEGVPLTVLAGKDYGMGSSRDWAAKGPCLLGVQAVIAESFERIHRSNLVGMGILPLQFEPGESWQSLGLTGRERFTIYVDETLDVGSRVEVEVEREDGSCFRFATKALVQTPAELEAYRHGGILQRVLRQMMQE